MQVYTYEIYAFMEIFDLLRDLGVFTIAAFIIRSIINRSAQRRFESYRSELERKTRSYQSSLDRRMEQYRSELSLHGYKATKAYEKQLEVITNLYRKLVILHDAISRMTSPFQIIEMDAGNEEKARVKKAAESYNEFLDYYNRNRLFIPSANLTDIEKIKRDYYGAWNDYTLGTKPSAPNFALAKKAGEKVQKEITPALKSLEQSFRELAGIEAEVTITKSS